VKFLPATARKRVGCGTRRMYIAGQLGRRRVARSETPGAAVESDDAVKLTHVSEEISELISEISERYGIGSPITARRLTGGYANDVFRLDGDGPPTVLHLKHPPVGADSLNWEHRLLAQLNKHLPEALAPVQALDGSTWFWFSRPPRLADPLGAAPLCRPGRPACCRHGARPFARVSGRGVHPTKPCPAARAAAAAAAPNPSIPGTVAHPHRPGPHRPEPLWSSGSSASDDQSPASPTTTSSKATSWFTGTG
jgi:hypothetical protein